jgi:hypothetical protein
MFATICDNINGGGPLFLKTAGYMSIAGTINAAFKTITDVTFENAVKKLLMLGALESVVFRMLREM